LPELPEPNFGSLFQTTLSCAAAWMASYSFGARDGEEVPAPNDDSARDVLDRALVDAERHVVLRRVGADAARVHPAGVPHSRDVHVLDVRVLPAHLVRDVDPVLHRPDELVVGHRLGDALAGRRAGLRGGEGEVEVLAADQLAVGDLAATARDDALADRQARDGHAELRGGHLQQLLPRVGGRNAGLRRAGRDTAGTAAAAREVQPGLLGRIEHLRHVHVELFGDEHQDAGRRACELRLAVRHEDGVVRADREPLVDRVVVLEVVLRRAGRERRIARGGRGRAGGDEADDHHAPADERFP